MPVMPSISINVKLFEIVFINISFSLINNSFTLKLTDLNLLYKGHYFFFSCMRFPLDMHIVKFMGGTKAYAKPYYRFKVVQNNPSYRLKMILGCFKEIVTVTNEFSDCDCVMHTTKTNTGYLHRKFHSCSDPH